MAAAAAMPSSQRVPVSSHRSVVTAVMITAIAPSTGPTCMIRCAPTRSERIPKAGDRSELRGEVGRREHAGDRAAHRRTAELGERRQVEGEHGAGQSRAEAQGEGPEEDGADRAHFAQTVAESTW